MARFYDSAFDPWLILLQMVVMQSLFYCSMGFFLFFFGFLLGVPIFLDQIFSASAVGLNDAPSVVVLLSFAFTSITWYPPPSHSTPFRPIPSKCLRAHAMCALTTHSAIFLVTVVERAKKCLDFAATIHIFHFIGCIVYAGFPTAWLWWLLMLFSLVCMTST
jgi:hypothetical protein